MKHKTIALRMILLAFLLCLCTACGTKKEKENPSGEYKLYSMESGGDTYTNEDIVSYGLDSMKLVLYEDGSGSMGFDDEVDAFTWTDGVITYNGTSITYVLADGMLTITDDTDTMTFTRIGDAPKKAEVTGGSNESTGEAAASGTDEISESETDDMSETITE